MTGTVTVAAADVRCVTEVLTLAARAFGASLQHVPQFGEALEACGRLAQAADCAGLPADPVSSLETLAVGHHEMMAAHERAGFDNDQAFAVVLTYITANASAIASANAMRGLNGG